MMTDLHQRISVGRQSGRPAVLSWLTISVPYVVELAASAGADAVLVDMQHGIAGKAELLASLTAAKASDCPALVRVPTLCPGRIGEVLDAGAQGVICPMINTAEDATRLVEAVKYPPLGARSYGPYRAKFMVEGDYFTSANRWTIACAQIETKQALNNLDAILQTDGLDMVLVGPNDLAISLSDGENRDIQSSIVLEALDQILAACKKHGCTSALFANDSGYADAQLGKDWDLMAVGTDAAILSAGLNDVISRVKNQQTAQ